MDEEVILCNVREGDEGEVIVSFLTDGEGSPWGQFEPDFAITLAHSLLLVAEPSLLRRLYGVWRTRKGSA
jgi:hypothetical protein